jgi:hypothetical protein
MLPLLPVLDVIGENSIVLRVDESPICEAVTNHPKEKFYRNTTITVGISDHRRNKRPL